MNAIPSIKQTLEDMGEITDRDRECIAEGFSRGNYAAAYETEDYRTAAESVNGVNGFYRVGMLLGFFSSYEVTEVPEEWREWVKHYRDVATKINLGV